MKQKSGWQDIIVSISAAAPVLLLAIIWKSMPIMVVTHYDIHFKPDHLSNKLFLWFVVPGLSLLSVGMYMLFKNIHRIDPKRYKNNIPDSLIKMGVGMAVFLSILNIIIIVSSNNNINVFKNLFFPLIGLLFSYLGYCMKHLQPNYFAGIRVPWTLNSKENWEKTHYYSSKLWFWGGLIIAFVSLFLSFIVSAFASISILLIMIILPIYYSYQLFKKERDK